MLIEDRAGLRRLAGRAHWIGGFHGAVSLALPDLTAGENLAYQTRLNRLLDACGCGTGGVGSLLALGLAVVAVVAGAPWFAGLGWVAAAGLGLLAFVVGGVAGKLIGLGHAHRRLLRTIQELEGRVGEEALHPGPTGTRPGVAIRDGSEDARPLPAR